MNNSGKVLPKPYEIKTMKKITHNLKKYWRVMNGDTSYERYLAHWAQEHAMHGEQALSRKDYFAAEMQRKWHGVRRCC